VIALNTNYGSTKENPPIRAGLDFDLTDD